MKLYFRQLGVAGKTVQVLYRSGHDFAKARAFGTLNFSQYGLGDIGLVFDDHDKSS
jgi:hypothetical protein